MYKPPTDIVIIDGQDVTKSEGKVKPKDLPSYWEKEYIHQRLDAIEDGSHKMLFTTLWFTGLRITEALSLKKKDIDFQNHTLEALWQKNKKYNYRTVPMHPTIKSMLEIYCANIKSDEYVFYSPGNRKKALSRQRAWQLSKKYFGGKPHKFRHSFAVNWLRNGGDIIILHRVLGHARVQTTMEYLKIVPVDQFKELSKIAF